MDRTVSTLHTIQPLNANVLTIDGAAETKRLGDFLRACIGRGLHRRGVVLGISGGIDSAVCAALAVEELGRERVFGLLMPERESGTGGRVRATQLCEALGISYTVEDITPALEALGCYRRRDDAIRRLFPEYGDGFGQKITMARGTARANALPYFELTIQAPSGHQKTQRMPSDVYLDVVAASNMKQRTRKQVEYYHAERLNYAVLGTPNRLEYELGFFVRGGDGLADIKPIAHLYKTQVYALAAHFGISESIRAAPPSTDTYTLPQTQEEFYFAYPYQQMDLLLFAFRNQIQTDIAARALGLSPAEVGSAYREILGKRRVASRGLQDALTVEPIFDS